MEAMLKTNLIPAYDNEELEKHSSAYESVEDYKKNSLITEDKKEVIKRLKEFRNNYAVEDKVKNIINIILDNISLLNKTKICWDGSYRNCVLLIRSWSQYFTHLEGFDYNNKNLTLTDKLQYIIDNVETFFIILDKQSYEEYKYELSVWDNIADNTYDDYYDNY